jgi:plastocyanin
MKLLLASLAAASLLAARGEQVVSQKDKKFSVTTLTVHTGDKVVFKNDDAVAHNVFSGSAGFAFNLKTQAPGAVAPMSFDKAGVVDVRCAFHPTMRLTINVQQ